MSKEADADRKQLIKLIRRLKKIEATSSDEGVVDLAEVVRMFYEMVLLDDRDEE